MSRARYDDVAEWYDAEFATTHLGVSAREVVLRLLGEGPGRLLDLGCGGGAHAVAFAERGWTVTGVDISSAQLELARARGIAVLEVEAAPLPVGHESFDAVGSMRPPNALADVAPGLRR